MTSRNCILGSVRFTEYIDCTWCLVTTTVAEITAPARCTTKIIHIEGTAVPHLNVSGGSTAVTIAATITKKPTAETHLPGNLAIRHWRVATIQPANGIPSVAPAPGRTCGCHPWPCCSFKSEPAGTKVIVTLPWPVSAIRLVAVSTAETYVVLTFWKTQKVNNKTKWVNKLVRESYHVICGSATVSTGQKWVVLISHGNEIRKC